MQELGYVGVMAMECFVTPNEARSFLGYRHPGRMRRGIVPGKNFVFPPPAALGFHYLWIR